MTRDCPREGCKRTVPEGMLLCQTCWRGIPIPLRRALHEAGKGGEGKGTQAHQAAMGAVIRFVNREPDAEGNAQ